MLTLIIKCFIVFTLLFIVVRVMGKRQIGEMQPFEFVVTIIAAEVVSIPITDASIPLTYGIVPILTLAVIEFLVSFLARKSLFARAVICGKPVMVITPDGVDYENLRQLNMTMHDLLENTRTAGYFDLEQIRYAVFETNGKLCVIPKAEFAPATNKDLSLKPEENNLPISLIVDGKFVADNLLKAELNKSDVEKHLSNAGERNYKELSLVMLDSAGKMYIQPRKGKYKVYNFNFSGAW